VGLQPLVTEEELICAHVGCKVPEGIFVNRFGENVSVEVKRLVSLAHGDGFYAGNGFVWASTVRSAMDKANENIVCAYDIRDHHIVLCVPENRRVAARLARHAARAAVRHAASDACACVARRVHIHVLPTPSSVM